MSLILSNGAKTVLAAKLAEPPIAKCFKNTLRPEFLRSSIVKMSSISNYWEGYRKRSMSN